MKIRSQRPLAKRKRRQQQRINKWSVDRANPKRKDDFTRVDYSLNFFLLGSGSLASPPTRKKILSSQSPRVKYINFYFFCTVFFCAYSSSVFLRASRLWVLVMSISPVEQSSLKTDSKEKRRGKKKRAEISVEREKLIRKEKNTEQKTYSQLMFVSTFLFVTFAYWKSLL